MQEEAWFKKKAPVRSRRSVRPKHVYFSPGGTAHHYGKKRGGGYKKKPGAKRNRRRSTPRRRGSVGAAWRGKHVRL